MKTHFIKKAIWTLLVISMMGVMGGAFAVKLRGADEYQLTRLSYFNRSILLVGENYYEPERVEPVEMYLQALHYVSRALPEFMVERKEDETAITLAVGNKKMPQSLESVRSIWKVSFLLSSALGFIEKNLPNLTVEKKKQIEYAAINGALSTLDPHSIFLTPETNDQMKMTTEGKFGGLGIVITLEEGELTVISPIPGTPAARAGIMAWDKIVTIGEESTINMPLDEAVSRLRGDPGTQITLGIMRKGFSAPKNFELTRAIITIKSVISDRLKGEKDKGDIGYIRIKNFQGNTVEDLKKHIELLTKGGEKDKENDKEKEKAKGKKDKSKDKGKDKEQEGVKGLILDFRNNPGGLLDASIKMSDLFLESGAIVSTVGLGNKLEEEKKATKTDSDIMLPIVVLVNAGSASASEIVAGALKNNDRAIVMGERTFGKGSVQVLYRFDDIKWADSKPNEETSLKLTIAQYLTPGGISIQTTGIVPDVELVSATVAKDYIELDPSFHANREQDLKKHFSRLNLSEEKMEALKPLERVTYLYSPPDPDEFDKKAFRQKMALDEDIEIDYPIMLAQRLLQNYASLNRSDMLEKNKEVFAKARIEQQAEIEKELQKRGINWKRIEASAEKPIAEVKLEILDEKPPLQGGDEVKMKLTVVNKGKGAFSRLRGISQSELAAWNEKEFIIGSIEPGKTASAEVKVTLPHIAHARADEIKIKFFEDNGNTPADYKTAATVLHPPLPRYEASYALKGKEADKPGALKIGEKAELSVKVKNIGKGVSPSLVATLKNDSGPRVFIDAGRLALNELEPGKEKSGKFVFEVKEGFEDKNVDMTFSVFDVKIRAYVSDKISVPLGGGASGRLLPPEITIKKDYSDAILEVPSVELEGSVKDEDGVKTLYITITNSKVSATKIFLKSLSEPSKEFDFKAQIPLEEGANLVSIRAIKGEEFTAYKTLIISRKIVNERREKQFSETWE